ncbi:MAG: betaine/proline/choline family ABC transporter ATP-binding protein [Candidatus Thiodiazotropha sp. (ex. Lucinisca nassula)]|nr:betaine/proline/choline family ABC transporter ATP-binding protein [Candidatus Thiodiazotropha sp. (ex. Lucinisca nassula)]PUB86331.1 MAG: glycine betaine/L-proline ABC transporter ATP-binding protein [gamma proteobacterium symbiont of Ctena orbiculata]
MSAHLELIQLSKVFGAGPKAGRKALQQGHSKSELLASSGYVIGVRDVSLRIEPGELFVVMGLSGSGKSTLVRMINRLIEPTTGRVMLDGVDVTAMSTRELVALRRDKMSMVFQSFALLPHLTVIDNVAFGLRVSGVDKKEARRRALEALQLVGIPEVADHRPNQLSGGMQQRAGLARAWVTEPEILLMDEAFSALDPLIRTEMQDALLDLQRTAQRTIVFISHDLAEAVRIADRIAVMAEGEICQVGTPAEIIDNPADEYVRAFFRDFQPGRLYTAGDIARPVDTPPVGEPVSASSLLEDILPRAAASEAPLPVADDDGNIIGSIERTRLLQALAKGRDA